MSNPVPTSSHRQGHGSAWLRQVLEDLRQANQRVLIIGVGVSALDSARRLISDRFSVVVCERRSLGDPRLSGQYGQALTELERLGVETHLGVDGEELVPLLDRIGLVVLSPGVASESPVMGTLSRLGLLYVSELELGLALLGDPAVVITGTNGKSTTARLIDEILRTAGRSERVVTASSYQLDNSLRLAPEVGVLLNISDNHLERYGTIERYSKTKARVLALQSSANLAVINGDDPLVVERVRASKAKVAAFGSKDKAKLLELSDLVAFVESATRISLTSNGEGESFDLSDFKLIGGHNRLNLAAAILVAKGLGVDSAVVRRVIAQVRGERYRMEPVDLGGRVRVWNDSKSTTVAAALAGLLAAREVAPENEIVMLLGGLSKAGSWEPLVRQVRQDDRCQIVCYGRDAGLIAGHFKAGKVEVMVENGLREGVARSVSIANSCAKPAAILFSPGCASFDQFADYARRGEEFKKLLSEAIVGGEHGVSYG
ncbi:MAG: UDP-N-acetylmuramoyl-L-alanine--D-glutamate ligase [Pseudomonadota bacterium]